MSERALATIEKIESISPIEGADAIELARVRGWDVVVKKGEFAPGMLCIYFEIDSMLPLDDPRYAFLEGAGKKIVDGRLYHRLKTKKLRGVVSQGLILPWSQFHAELSIPYSEDEIVDGVAKSLYGFDMTNRLGIFKYEPPVPAELRGNVNGDFPTHLCRKTDSERVQNLGRHWDSIKQHSWVATEKIDGTSLTVINDEGTIRVCGRNWEQKLDNGTAYVEAAMRFAHLLEPNTYVQGELYGEGIQKNPLGLKGTHVSLFTYGICREGPSRWADWPTWAAEMAAPTYVGMELPDTIDEAVDQVNGLKSLVNPERLAEGVVWHLKFPAVSPIDRPNFKAINNKYLLKYDD